MNARSVAPTFRNPHLESLVVLAGFLGLALLLRLGVFPRSVINFDESDFLLLGRSLLRGEIPYTTIWEHSPVGGFALFALIQAIFGQTVLAIRIATWLAAAIESFLLYQMGKVIAGKRGLAVGIIAGTLYAFFSLNNDGLSAQREIFLAPCVTFAVYVLLSGQPCLSNLRLLLAGTAMGLALQLKYMYVFEFIAVTLITTAIVISQQRHAPARSLPKVALLKSYVLLGIGPLLLLIIPAAFYALTGHWDVFFQANFKAAAAYTQTDVFSLTYLIRRVVFQVQTNFLIWLGVALLPFYLVVGPVGNRPYLVLVKDVDRRERRNLLYLLAWFLIAFVGTASTRKYFEHYYLQLLPPASVITAAVIVGVLGVTAIYGRARYVLALILVLAGPLFSLGYSRVFDSAALLYRHSLRGMPLLADEPMVIAQYLRGRVTHEDAIYMPDYEPIIYYLVDAKIPTKYAFPPILSDQVFGPIVGDQTAELRKIMDQRPLYVIKQTPPSRDFDNPPLAAELEKRLAQDYILEKTFGATETFTRLPITVELYRVRPQP